MDGTLLRARLARSRLWLALDGEPPGDAWLDAALRGGVDVLLGPGDDRLGRAADAHGALHLGHDGAPLQGATATRREDLSATADFLEVRGDLELVRAARDAVRVPWFAAVDAASLEDAIGWGAAGVSVCAAALGDDPEPRARRLRASLPTTDAVVTHGEVSLPQIDWLTGTAAAGASQIAPHTHAVHADVFYVLEGEMEFRVGDGTVRVPAGSCVAAPPLLVHGFRNPADADARFLNLHAPGVWARGREHGLPPAEYDTFGVELASASVRPVVSAPGDGDPLRKPHRVALVKVERPELDVFEYLVDDGYTGASLHVHLLHADCFHVLEGELVFGVDGEEVRAGRGTSVIVPPGVPHEFTSAGRARFVNVHAPSFGFAGYLRKVDAGEAVDAAAHDAYDLVDSAPGRS